MNGDLRGASDKSTLMPAITSEVECPATISVSEAPSILIIDGQALVVALGKPSKSQPTFGDFAIRFAKRIKYLGAAYTRVDIVFDRYRKQSLKASTRKKRGKGKTPVRREIKNDVVPLPSDWKAFLALPENKADLANFLSEEMMKYPFGGLEVFVAGGFKDERRVESTNPGTPVQHLAASHEEGDTRVVLHATRTDFPIKVIMARDTDITLLAVHHFDKMNCQAVWVMAGTESKRKHIPVHTIASTLTRVQRENILAFHALTGCDITSKSATISKKQHGSNT